MATKQLRIAVASPGIGRVQRGYERVFTDLSAVMRAEFDMVLLKGGGLVSDHEKVPLFVHRNAAVLRALPVHRLFGRTAHHTECLLFALGMLPHLRRGAFDIVHTIDPPLTRLLFKMRARLGLRFTLLHTEGAGMPPSDYPPADHFHHVAPSLMDDARAYGHDSSRMTLVPCGIYPERFVAERSRAALRAAAGIAPETFVVLSVAALNRTQKRTDYLVDEMAKVDGDWVLLLDGSTDHGDPALAEYARAKLGPRLRISHVPSGQVRDLYTMADVMVHVALRESFGLTIVEAAAAGLPVVSHNGPHFSWLLPNPACWIDAAVDGALAERVRDLMTDRSHLEAMRCPAVMQHRFSWQSLRPDYAAMYSRVADRGPRTAAETCNWRNA